MTVRKVEHLGVLVPGSIKLGSMGLIPRKISLETLAHPLTAHEVHSIIVVGISITTDTASASAVASRLLLLFHFFKTFGQTWPSLLWRSYTVFLFLIILVTSYGFLQSGSR